MDLRLVQARGALALPQERHGVEAQHLDAPVRQEEHDVEHLPEHARVGVVQVPLVVVERRPDPPEPGHLREAAGRGVREDLREGGRVPVGERAVTEDVVVVAVHGIAGGRAPGPRVLAGGVVHHEVDAQADAPAPQRGGELLEIGHVPEARIDRAVVHDGVPAVVRRRPGTQQRHEVQVGDAEPAQIVELVRDLGERPSEPVGVADVAHLLLPQVPVRGDLATMVEDAQVVVPGRSRVGHEPQEVGHEPVEVAGGAVHLVEGLVDVDEAALDAGEEGGRVAGAERRAGVLGQGRLEALERAGGTGPHRGRRTQRARFVGHRRRC